MRWIRIPSRDGRTTDVAALARKVADLAPELLATKQPGTFEAFQVDEEVRSRDAYALREKTLVDPRRRFHLLEGCLRTRMREGNAARDVRRRTRACEEV